MIDRVRLRSNQWRKLRGIVMHLATSDSFYGRRFREWGVRTMAMNRLEDFVAKIPPTVKADILQDRIEHPPFGTNLMKPLSHYTRFCATSGTSTGQPMAWIDTPESWETMLACWRRVYEAAALEKGKDRLLFAFSFGPFLGFWTAFEAAAKDYLVIPAGGLSSQARLEAMVRYGVTVLCCTPTYAQRLGEMIGDASGIERLGLRVRKIIVAGEVGGSIPEVRKRIESLWDCEVFDHHGMTEVGPVSHELPGHPGTLCVMEDAYFAEVVNPDTLAEVAEGECGELLLTNLDRTACPLLRYRTGDWVRKRIIDGRLCLEGGMLGRIDEMAVIRGVNVYPSAIENIVREFREVGEFLIEQRKVDGMEELELQVELDTASASSLIKKIEHKLRDTLHLRIPVKPVEKGTLPRSEFKAKRWRRVSAE